MTTEERIAESKAIIAANGPDCRARIEKIRAAEEGLQLRVEKINGHNLNISKTQAEADALLIPSEMDWTKAAKIRSEKLAGVEILSARRDLDERELAEMRRRVPSKLACARLASDALQARLNICYSKRGEDLTALFKSWGVPTDGQFVISYSGDNLQPLKNQFEDFRGRVTNSESSTNSGGSETLSLEDIEAALVLAETFSESNPE